MSNPFAPATRHQLRGRIAIDGPTGAGKTYTALAWATELAGAEGRIAVVDTERGSASLYSDRFTFDVLTWVPPYDPRKLAETIQAAEQAGYDVLVLDSLTHFWKGEGGTMDIVDAAASRQGGNSFAGWKVGTPALRTLIDTMLGCNMHVIATMRSKMEHVLVEDNRGRKVPQKIGMQPEMRADIEYEFTLCIAMDLDHRGTVTKSRCEALADSIIPTGLVHVAEAADVFLNWLHKGAPQVALIDPATRDYLIEWANSLSGEARAEMRALWPVGVPMLRDPSLNETHAERIEALLTQFGAPPKREVADPSAPSADDRPAEAPADPSKPTADEVGDPAIGLADPIPRQAAPEPEHAEGPDPDPQGTDSDIEPGSEFDGPTPTSDKDSIDWGEFAKSLGTTKAQLLRIAREVAEREGMAVPVKIDAVDDALAPLLVAEATGRVAAG